MSSLEDFQKRVLKEETFIGIGKGALERKFDLKKLSKRQKKVQEK